MKINKTIKKIFIFALLVIILLVVTNLLHKYLRKQQKINELNQVESTGAAVFSDSSQRAAYEEYFTLYSQLPISNNEWELRIMEEDGRFIVTLKNSNSRNSFESWLKNNNFSNIPQDKFYFDN